MEYFRFTLFNGITLFLLAVTVWLVAWRVRERRGGNWPLAYWALAGAYTAAFHYGLEPWIVAFGAACAIAIRFRLWRWYTRVPELAALCYVAYRSVGLILLW